MVVEATFDEEMSDHLGYDKGDQAGRSRSRTRVLGNGVADGEHVLDLHLDPIDNRRCRVPRERGLD